MPLRRTGLVVDVLAPLGDYLRERSLVTGYAFEQTGEGVTCRFLDCRFAELAHKITQEAQSCAQCPVFLLMQEAFRKREPHCSLRNQEIRVEDAVTCVFHLALESTAGEESQDGRV